jgi:hypothetical protein
MTQTAGNPARRLFPQKHAAYWSYNIRHTEEEIARLV